MVLLVAAAIRVICGEYSCIRMCVSHDQTCVKPHVSASFAFYGNALACIVAHGTFDAIQMFVLIPMVLRPGGGG